MNWRWGEAEGFEIYLGERSRKPKFFSVSKHESVGSKAAEVNLGTS